MKQTIALVVSGWWKTHNGHRLEIDRVQIESIDFFKDKKNESKENGGGRSVPADHGRLHNGML